MEKKNKSKEKQFKELPSPWLLGRHFGHGLDEAAGGVVKIPSSYSERDLFRKTILVLVCVGCKDNEIEKLNKK